MALQLSGMPWPVTKAESCQCRRITQQCRRGAYAVWRKPEGITDKLLRAILDAHFTTPDVERQQELERSIAHLDKIIEQEFALLASKGPFIIEDIEQGED